MNYEQSEINRMLLGNTMEWVGEGYKFSMVISSPNGAKTKHLSLTLEQLKQIKTIIGE